MLDDSGLSPNFGETPFL